MSGRRYKTEARPVTRTRLRRQVEGEAKLRHLLNALADGILIVDGRGVVRYANPAAESLFGRSCDELLGAEFGYPITAGRTRPGARPKSTSSRAPAALWR